VAAETSVGRVVVHAPRPVHREAPVPVANSRLPHQNFQSVRVLRAYVHSTFTARRCSKR